MPPGQPAPSVQNVAAVMACYVGCQASRPGCTPGAIPRVPLIRDAVARSQWEGIPRRIIGGCDDFQQDQRFGDPVEDDALGMHAGHRRRTLQRSPREVIEPRASIEQQHEGDGLMPVPYRFASRRVAVIGQHRVHTCDLVIQHVGAKHDPRHGVERRGHPDGSELLESADQVRHIEQMWAESFTPPRQPVCGLERLCRHTYHVAPLLRRPLPEGLAPAMHLAEHDARCLRACTRVHTPQRIDLVQRSYQAAERRLGPSSHRAVQGSVAADQHRQGDPLNVRERAAVVTLRVDWHTPHRPCWNGLLQGANVHRRPGESVVAGSADQDAHPDLRLQLESLPPTRPVPGGDTAWLFPSTRVRQTRRYPQGGRQPL